MREFLRQHWVYLLGALLLHVLFAGVFALTLFQFSRNAPTPQLAIEAVVVDESALASARRDRERERAREQERLRAEREKELAAQREKELAEQRRLEEERIQREARARAERERQMELQRRLEEEQRKRAEEAQLRARQEEQRRREAEAERQRRAEEERKRAEEIKRKQEEEARRRREAEEARAQAAREEELRRQLAAEEELMRARSSSAMAEYVALIKQHIERRWRRPPSVRPDLECEVRVSQAPGGTVISAEVTRCNGDNAVRQSIEAAVMSASPLPQPSDPRLFERTLLLVFKAED
ncbi:MAG: cell envelope integrity protein TolA [Gammaproteobacteria bacterium]|nr:protein TolA [Gammaproteobacteria bacterium]